MNDRDGLKTNVSRELYDWNKNNYFNELLHGEDQFASNSQHFATVIHCPSSDEKRTKSSTSESSYDDNNLFAILNSIPQSSSGPYESYEIIDDLDMFKDIFTINQICNKCGQAECYPENGCNIFTDLVHGFNGSAGLNNVKSARLPKKSNRDSSLFYDTSSENTDDYVIEQINELTASVPNNHNTWSSIHEKSKRNNDSKKSCERNACHIENDPYHSKQYIMDNGETLFTGDQIFTQYSEQDNLSTDNLFDNDSHCQNDVTTKPLSSTPKPLDLGAKRFVNGHNSMRATKQTDSNATSPLPIKNHNNKQNSSERKTSLSANDQNKKQSSKAYRAEAENSLFHSKQSAKHIAKRRNLDTKKTTVFVNGSSSQKDCNEVIATRRDTQPRTIIHVISGIAKEINLPIPSDNKTIARGYFGDDAAFFAETSNGYVLGIADGAGGNRGYGFDPRKFAQELMYNCARFVVENTDAEKKPNEALFSALQACQDQNVFGSGTACICSLEKKTGYLHTINVGDSGFIVIREGSLYKKAFRNYRSDGSEAPIQLDVYPWSFENRSKNIVESGEIGNVEEMRDVVEVRKSDIILMASDGVLDNVSVEKIVEILNSNLGYPNPSVAGLSPAADAIVIAAKSEKSKPDDIIVLLAMIV